MSFTPPPQPNQPQPGQGDGYGPPQGFGPPPPPQSGGGYGYPGQGQGGYPPPGGGGYGDGGGGYGPGGPGGYPPPNGGGGGNGGKIAAIAIGAVVIVAVLVGGLVVILGGKDDDTSADSSSTTPTASQTSTAAATDTATDPAGASSDPADSLVPYVVLSAGKCFDHPGLNSSIKVVTTRSCSTAHDGEVIANETLTGSFTTEAELRKKVLSLCEKDAKARLAKIPADGKTYYYYAIYPSLDTYTIQNKDTISCSLTLSDKVDGKQLTKPLA